MRPARLLATILGCLLLAGSAFLTCCAAFTPSGQVFVLGAAVTHWALIGYAAGLLLVVLGRGSRPVRAGLALVALLGIAIQATWLAPFFTGEHPDSGANLRVVQLNTNHGQADPTQIKALLDKTHPDVLVLAEATPDLLGALAENGSVGPGGVVPNLAPVPSDLARGTVTFSRSPVTFEDSVPVSDGAYRFRVAAAKPFTLIALHPAEPLVAHANWKDDYDNLVPWIAATKGPRLVVGDFNLTDRNAQMRQLLDSGLRDAAEQANSGWQPTWPSRRPGILMIDHTLMSKEFAAVRTRTIHVPGSDHLALVSDLARS